MIADTFNSIPGIKCNPVQGAMYAFPRVNYYFTTTLRNILRLIPLLVFRLQFLKRQLILLKQKVSSQMHSMHFHYWKTLGSVSSLDQDLDNDPTPTILGLFLSVICQSEL